MSGITLAGLSVSVVGYLAGISSVAWMSTYYRCLLAFLVYNSRPASIFLEIVQSYFWVFSWLFNLLASFREGGVLDGIFPVLALHYRYLTVFLLYFVARC